MDTAGCPDESPNPSRWATVWRTRLQCLPLRTARQEGLCQGVARPSELTAPPPFPFCSRPPEGRSAQTSPRPGQRETHHSEHPAATLAHAQAASVARYRGAQVRCCLNSALGCQAMQARSSRARTPQRPAPTPRCPRCGQTPTSRSPSAPLRRTRRPPASSARQPLPRLAIPAAMRERWCCCPARFASQRDPAVFAPRRATKHAVAGVAGAGTAEAVCKR